jgi:hypothetical protein
MPTNGTTTVRPVAAPGPRDLTRESIAGGSLAYVGNYARALPTYIDDISRDFDLGDSVYARMSVDPQIAAALSIFKASILEDGVTFAPAVEDADDPDYDLATEISDECERMWDDLSTASDDVLWNMMDSIAEGNKLAEQVYELRPGVVTGRRLLQLESLKVKPRQSYLFVTDAFDNLVGILGRRPGDPMPTGGRWPLDTKNPPENLFATQKFAIASFRPKDGDPRGTSILRPAYDPWWRKRQALVEYVKYLAQFAGPSIWATLPEGTTPAGAALDYLGNVQTTSTGTPASGPSPLDDLLASLQAFRNGTAGAFAHGTELHELMMQGEGAAFLRAIAECNMSIVKTILTQTLTTEEGEHQARAAAQVHQDVLDTLVRQGKRSVVRMVAKQILRPWVTYNWGEQVAQSLVPKASLGSTEEVDRAPMIQAIASLAKSPYLHPSQLPELDSMLGLPVRDLSQDEPVVVSGPQGSEPPPAGDGVSGTPPADAPSQPGQPPADQQQSDQGQQEEEPPVPPNKVKVRPHIRGKPRRRKPQARSFWRTAVSA